VELFAMCVDPLRQLTGERPRALDQLRQRATGDVPLVAGENRVSALLGTAHGDILSTPRSAQARETYSPLRVSTRIVSPASMKSGTWTVTPDSSVAGLLPPPEAVSPLSPGSVWVTFMSIALGTATSLGRSSTKSTSTSAFGRTHRIESPSVPRGISICS